MSGEYLLFTIDDERCAIPISVVREVIPYQPITVVPSAPRTIRGVIDLRGKVVPIVDLAAKFGFKQRPTTKWTCLIIVEADLGGEATLLAVVADTVDDVLELGPADLLPPPSFGTRVRLEYLRAMGRLEQGFALVLDAERLLSIEEIMSVAPPPAAEERAR
ncbi:MAG TPA: chemotaxis protein CheW [Polyangiaceae bacterium]|jgi:purine-binding chemotaxis protein CheW